MYFCNQTQLSANPGKPSGDQPNPGVSLQPLRG